MERTDSYSMGGVQGRYGKELLLCTLNKKFATFGCLWNGCNPYNYRLPVILSQFTMFNLVFRFIYFFLKSFGQSTLNSQILAGMILGKSLFGKNEFYWKTFFPQDTRMVVETIADFGFMLHLFVIGIHIDPGLVKKMGKGSAAVGIASFIAPFIVCMICIKFIPPSETSKYSFAFLIMAISMTSFAGTSHLLSDLKILNSELGRLATLAAMVNDACNCVFFIAISALTATRKQKQRIIFWSILWQSMILGILFLVVRPWIMRFAKKFSLERKPLKEIHFIGFLVTAFLMGTLFNLGGMPTGIGCLLYGTVIPGGMPLSSTLISKIDSFISGLILPAKFGIAGFFVKLFDSETTAVELLGLLFITIGYITKFFGVVISGLVFNKISLWESVVLGLVMCCRGVVEVSIYMSLRESARISVQAFDSLILSMLIVTGIARPIILKLYDPWSKYGEQQIYSILQSEQRRLRTLVCIHMEDNVQPIIDLLFASNPTKESPLYITVLNLMELKGRLSAVLEHKLYNGKISTMLSRTHHMANAFDYLVAKCRGSVIVNHFTSIAPYATMHTDICNVALEARAHLIIIPFHKQKQIDGSYHSNLPVLQSVNQNVFRNSPSTVALLIDRSQTAGAWQPTVINGLKKYNFLRISVLFLGGVDDREALALATRMIGQRKLVNLTLVWLRYAGGREYSSDQDICLDDNMIRDFRTKMVGRENIICYREELAKDAVGTTRVLRSFEGHCDLCIIGRYHDPYSPLTQEILNEWSDCPELGAIGDMLSNTDFSYSVLVVKQHKMEDIQFFKRHSFNR